MSEVGPRERPAGATDATGSAAAARPEVSIVIPVYNEEQNLPALLARLEGVAPTLPEHEVVFVNDGSRDRSLEILREASARMPRLVVVDLNRNYGQHAAVFAGFAQSRGDVVVTLDADLQNPPEEIPRLLAEIAKGYDVCGSVRVQRQDSAFRKVASRIVNRVAARSIGLRLTDYGCMLRAYRRSVVEAISASGENSTFIPVLADLFAGSVTEIPVAHHERAAGKSQYSAWKLVRLQFDLFTSFTVLPLRLTMAFGFVTSIVSLLVALVLLGGRVLFGSAWAVSGVFTLFAGLFALLGFLIFSVGLLGEYVGRIYTEVRRRPRYVVRTTYRGGQPMGEGRR